MGLFRHGDAMNRLTKELGSNIQSSPARQLFCAWACKLLEVMRCYQFSASGPVCLTVRVLFDGD